MVTLKNKITKNTIVKSKKDADIILNNKVFGGDWQVISEDTRVETPPEVVKVSISEKTQEVKPDKPTKKNNAN